jgi:hypothetical protein
MLRPYLAVGLQVIAHRKNLGRPQKLSSLSRSLRWFNLNLVAGARSSSLASFLWGLCYSLDLISPETKFLIWHQISLSSGANFLMKIWCQIRKFAPDDKKISFRTFGHRVCVTDLDPTKSAAICLEFTTPNAAACIGWIQWERVQNWPTRIGWKRDLSSDSAALVATRLRGRWQLVISKQSLTLLALTKRDIVDDR